MLIPDLPGHGRSPLLKPYSLEGVRSAVERDLAARGVHDVAVVGASIGAYHALGMALAGRIRVRRMVLLGPIAGADPEVKSAFLKYAQAFAAGVDFAEPMVSLSVPAEWADAHPGEVAALKARIAETPLPTQVAECEAIGRMADLRPRLPGIHVPTLVRVGDADRSTPPAWAGAVARAISGAVLQVVPGVGHLQLEQDAEATVAALVRFLSQEAKETAAAAADGRGARG